MPPLKNANRDDDEDDDDDDDEAAATEDSLFVPDSVLVCADRVDDDDDNVIGDLAAVPLELATNEGSAKGAPPQPCFSFSASRAALISSSGGSMSMRSAT